MTKEQQTLFRKEALEQQKKLKTLDTSLQIISSKTWIIIVGITVFIITAVFWSIFGLIPIKVYGKGILIAKSAGIFQASAPQGGGEVIKLLVKPGDTVTKGQLLAILSASNLVEEHRIAKEHWNELVSKQIKLVATSNQEIATYKQNYDQQKNIMETQLINEKKYFVDVTDHLEVKRKAYGTGLISKDMYMVTLSDYNNSKQKIESYKQQLKKLDLDLASFDDKWQERLREFDLTVKQKKQEVNQLEQKLILAEQIKSPMNGIVNDVQTSVGNQVSAGDTVLTISERNPSLEALVFVPASDGKKIKLNMKAQVSPSTVKKEEYGSILGNVEMVSTFPTTPEGMSGLLHNKDLEKYFSQEGSTIFVRVRLKKDLGTQSGYAWTSSSGPNQTVNPGTLATASIIVEEKRPITLIISSVKRLLGED